MIAALVIMPDDNIYTNGWIKFCNELTDFCKSNSMEIMGTFHKYISEFDVRMLSKSYSTKNANKIGQFLRHNESSINNHNQKEFDGKDAHMVILIYGVDSINSINRFLSKGRSSANEWHESIVMHSPSTVFEVSEYLRNELKMDYDKTIIRFLEEKLFSK